MIVLWISSFLLSVLALQFPKGEVVKDVMFLGNKLFYATQSKAYFGFLNLNDGQYMTLEQVKEDEAIISFDHHAQQMVLRRQRHNAVLFRLGMLQVKELTVEMEFVHQKVVQIIERTGRLFVVTDKDLREYDLETDYLQQSSQNIISSCRKGEWLLKLLPSEPEPFPLRLVLLRQREVCLRTIFSRTASSQKCFFNITSDITTIQQIGEEFLITSQEYVYVIRQNNQPYSFRKRVKQIGHFFTTLEGQFKTFTFQSQVVVDGLGVEGSTSNDMFFIKRNSSQTLELYHNQKLVGQIPHQDNPLRAWVHPRLSSYRMLLQFDPNQLQLWTLSGESLQLSWSQEKGSTEEEVQQL